MQSSNLDRLLQLIDAPDGKTDLAEVALWVAKQQYPALDVAYYLERLEGYAAAIALRLAPDAPAGDVIFAINEYLFSEQRFSGNSTHYYDPCNGFLNEVMESRRGIPITLSILYIAVGRQLGLALHGVSFPGRFLVALGHGEGAVIDPYAGGLVLSEYELRQLLVGQERYRDVTDLTPLLKPVGKRHIILRLLRNLKANYLKLEQPENALWAVDLMLRIDPDQITEWRDRGNLYERLQYGRGAAADYLHYLELYPEAKDGDTIRARLLRLVARPVALH